MGWKIFTVVFACFALSALVGIVTGKYVGPVAVASLVMHLVAMTGLASYAFDLNLLPSKFWRGFSIAYGIFSVLSLGHLAISVANKIAAGQLTILVALGVIGVPLALQYFSWLPSRRLSTQP